MIEEHNILRKSRKNKGVSIEKISMDTRIPVAKLKALEEGDLQVFDSKFYARSFLKQYARYLDVPLNDIRLFEDEDDHDQDTIPADNSASEPVKYDNIRRFSPVTVIFSLIIFFVSAVGAGLYFLPGDLLISKYFSKFYKPEVVTASKPKSSLIGIKAVTTEPTWIRVTADGSITQENILDTDSTYYWNAKKSLKIRVGYIGGIKIYYRDTIDDRYREIDLKEGSKGAINELEFLNENSN